MSAALPLPGDLERRISSLEDHAADRGAQVRALAALVGYLDGTAPDPESRGNGALAPVFRAWRWASHKIAHRAPRNGAKSPSPTTTTDPDERHPMSLIRSTQPLGPSTAATTDDHGPYPDRKGDATMTTRPRRPRKQEPGYGLKPRALQRRALLHFMQKPCRRHEARRGDPCWTLPSGTVPGAEHIAVCGPRIDAAKNGGRR